jgi:hypothetical protein
MVPLVRSRVSAASVLGLACLVTALGATPGCGCLRGAVNVSPELRWWLFSNFGASKVCPEMLKHGVGLRMQDRPPAVGRFFPQSCQAQLDDENKLVTVHFVGTGYAYTPVTRRVGFTVTSSVQYRPDFYMAEDDIYVWGKVHRIVHGPDFRLGYVENPVVDVATGMTPLGNIANLFGNQIVAGELTRGFTVLQNYDTDTKSFALGILVPPQKPQTPFDIDKDERLTYANETVEVGWQQRDYLGPFEIAEGDQALFMRFVVQGPTVDVMVVSKPVGEAWRRDYEQGRPLGPPPGPVLAGGPVAMAGEVRQTYRLAPGQYYVVIDHTQYAGIVMPPPAQPLNPLGGPSVRVSYVAQLGEL